MSTEGIESILTGWKIPPVEPQFSVETSDVTAIHAGDFCKPMNPKFDIRSLVTTPTDSMPVTVLTMDDVLTMQERLVGWGERLPLYLALREGESAISLVPLPGYSYVAVLEIYIPDRHMIIANLTLAEIASPDTAMTHGQHDTYRAGCTGPLCRRSNRIYSAELANLRRQRLSYHERKAEAHGCTTARRRRRLAPGMNTRQYRDVEPLLRAFADYITRTVAV